MAKKQAFLFDERGRVYDQHGHDVGRVVLCVEIAGVLVEIQDKDLFRVGFRKD